MVEVQAEAVFKAELVAAIPHLRAFARSLCNDPTQADDLAQEALAKAWKARDSFEPGTSIKAWTFMILR
ncbi:MAG: sigma factor, partial [Hyphomonadaceae bacterium]|nr:sigma factor [Hyphomonadaceae bacterium]